ncbi:MAG: hypothetical protein ABI844_16485 [Saprospiraceae bacterium]
MKNLRYILIGLLGISLLACKTEIVDPIDEFSFEQGGYMRIVTPYPLLNATFSVSKANLGGTKMEMLAEAVTPNKGANFASYEMLIKFVDKTPANGNKSTTDKTLRTLAATDYTIEPTTGYPRATIAVTGTQALSACGLMADDISKGDYFTITTTMVLKDGKKFNADNTGANITGGAFYSSPFIYRINVAD